MVDIDYVKYDKSYKENVLDLLGTELHWKKITSNERRNHFEWLYEMNPYIEEPLNYLVIDRDKVVGHVAFLPFKFKVENNASFIVVIPNNAILLSDYQGKGIFKNLLNFSHENIYNNNDIKFILALSHTNKTCSASLKAGYIPIGKRTNQYFFSPISLIKNKIHARLKYIFPIDYKEGDIEIRITDKVEAQDLSEFMSKFIHNKQISNVRDVEFYKWRFADSPYENIYLYCRKDNELVGYIVLQRNSNKTFLLMEYFYICPSHFKSMMMFLSRNLSIPFLMVNSFTRPKEELSLFSEMRFLSEDDKKMNILILKHLKLIKDQNLPGALIRPAGKEIDNEDFIVYGKDTRSPDAWSLFKSDIF